MSLIIIKENQQCVSCDSLNLVRKANIVATTVTITYLAALVLYGNLILNKMWKFL